MQAKFGGELFPAHMDVGDSTRYLEFLQHDRDGGPKGVVRLDLGELAK